MYDPDVVKSVVKKWRRLLPKVTPFFAVKANPSPLLLQTLFKMGVSFDCASPKEISTIKALFPDGAWDPSKVIFAHPIKTRHSIEFAVSLGIDLFVVDSLSELDNFSAEDRAAIVLRIDTSDSTAQCVLASKYGAPAEEWREIATRARELGLRIAGVSFHVGSGAQRLDTYRVAICDARRCFDVLAECGHDDACVLDLGGGYVSRKFDECARIITLALAENGFDDGRKYTVIAEPGRLFCADAFTLYTPILNIKRNSVVIADSVYGSFNCIQNDHFQPEPLFNENDGPSKRRVTLFGSTCDGGDIIQRDFLMPESKIQLGATICWPKMGAYTLTSASNFNGLQFADMPVETLKFAK